MKNVYRNEEEDYNNDGETDGTIRVYAKTDAVNEACILDGKLPEQADEIAIDRMHADNVGIKVGDIVSVSGKKFRVTGLIAYVNYATLHEKATDFMFDALKFDVAMVTDEGFNSLHKKVHFAYAWVYEEKPADDVAVKEQSDDFMRALLTQTVVADNEIADYVPAYANPAVNFATEDIGSDEAMGGVLLYILIGIIAFIFAITNQQHDRKGGCRDWNTAGIGVYKRRTHQTLSFHACDRHVVCGCDRKCRLAIRYLKR